MQAFEYLGNKCQVCDVNDWRMLQINHINGNGRKEVTGSQKHRLYRDIVAGKRKDINLLCANHNALYEYERGKRGKYLKEFKKITEDAEKKYDEGRQS